MWARTVQKRGAEGSREKWRGEKRSRWGCRASPTSPALEILQDVGHDVILGSLLPVAQVAAWSSQLLELPPQRTQQNARRGDAGESLPSPSLTPFPVLPVAHLSQGREGKLRHRQQGWW